MPDISAIIQSGAANPWLYLPLALLLGALHALEPGHSKSLMAGYIVAIRGTPRQAMLLGLSIAVGHSIVVWGLAILGFWLGNKLILGTAEPWLLLASGVLIVLLGLRLLRVAARGEAHHHHDHGHPGAAAHHHDDDDHHDHDHGDHDHHDHDAHEPGHHEAAQPRRPVQAVSPLTIAWFGFTGGLMPCPSAIAVLLVCLQAGAFGLGVAMVAAFSVGIAVTLVTVGVLAAWGASAAASRFPWFATFAERLPYASAAIVTIIGVVVIVRGLFEAGIV